MLDVVPMIQLRWFVEVMHEGWWDVAYIAMTKEKAEVAADKVYVDHDLRDVRVVQRRSCRKVGPVT